MMKHKRLKRFFAFLAVILCLMSCVVPVFAFDSIRYAEDYEESFYREAIPASIRFQSSTESTVRESLFDISHDFLVLRAPSATEYSYSHAQAGGVSQSLNLYEAGELAASVGGYQSLINMQEDLADSVYGYMYDNVQYSLVLNNFSVRYADIYKPKPIKIFGGDFYVENLTTDGNLFYFYYYIKADALPDFNQYDVSVAVRTHKYGSEFADDYAFSIRGGLMNRTMNPSIPYGYDYAFVFGVPVDRLGYKWDKEAGQIVDRNNGEPFEGLYIDAYEITIDLPPAHKLLVEDVEFSLMQGSYRIDMFHALQPHGSAMRDKDLDAKLSVADNINFHIDFIADAIGGFFNLQIFPGFSLGGLLLVILAFSMVMWFLRVFGGG